MTLSYVRKAFEAAGVSDSVLLRRGLIYLDPKLEIFRDYEVFADEAGKAIHYADTGSPRAVAALEQAVRSYNGKFLPENIYDEEIDNTRSSLHDLYLEVLLKLAGAYYKKENWAAALEACRRYLASEPVEEAVVRLAMDVLWKMGKKRKALSLYQTLTATLAEEYDTAPETETLALYQTIRGSTK